jgi:CheY-like chemotaxis protein
LIERVVEEMQPVAQAAKVHLVADAMPVALTADPDRVLQVLTNLISNAIRFSDPDTSVFVSSELSEGMALFRVSDSGRGIPAEKLESIFGRFSQVDSSDTREKDGTGLGLSICHTIVRHHQGHIWVESELGKGSTFTFALPVEPGAHEPSQDGCGPVREGRVPSDRLVSAPACSGSTLETTQRRSQMGRKHILLIDDEDGIRAVTGVCLETVGGWEVSSASGGRDGIALAIAEQPDAILCDVMMPDLDGPETVARLQADPATRDIPVILLTARVLAADRERFEELAVAGVLYKPFDPMMLSDDVDAILARQPAEPASVS